MVLGLHVGDFLHNLRSALDHLVYELAAAHTAPLPTSAAETCEFPVFWKKPMDARQEQSKIGSVHPDAATLIGAMQPHRKGGNYKDDPLWILNELERIDKHRTLNVASHKLSKNDIAGINMNVRAFTGIADDEVVTRGSMLAEFFVERIDPNQPMHVDYRPSTIITFGRGLPLSGKPLGSSLRKLYEDVERITVIPLERFL